MKGTIVRVETLIQDQVTLDAKKENLVLKEVLNQRRVPQELIKTQLLKAPVYHVQEDTFVLKDLLTLHPHWPEHLVIRPTIVVERVLLPLKIVIKVIIVQKQHQLKLNVL